MSHVPRLAPRPPRLSVIVPAHGAANLLPLSLSALVASDLPRDQWELIVVDDASRDGTASVAAGFADVVVRLTGEPRGPAYARNRGAEVATAPILAFIDADVRVHRDTIRRFVDILESDQRLAAVSGSYDAAPPADDAVSQYRNLLEHWRHQTTVGAPVFCSGCGAVRSEDFLRVGKFDEWQFRRPQVEDVELGDRLRNAGRLSVRRGDVQATHLKSWTLGSAISADAWDRSLPWARLVDAPRAEQHLGRHRRWSAEGMSSALVWLALALSVAAIVGGPRWALAAVLVLGVVCYVNRALYAFFIQVRGPGFLAYALPLSLLGFLANGFSVTAGRALRAIVGDAPPEPSVQAFAEVGLRTWPPVRARRPDDA